MGYPYVPCEILQSLGACALGAITSTSIVAVQLNAAYIDGQISWLTTNLAASTADYNIVIVSFNACILHCNSCPVMSCGQSICVSPVLLHT